MRIIALDIGEKRIGLAYADSNVRIALPRRMIPVDSSELEVIAKAFDLEKADIIVAGLPRNNSGEETRQSQHAQEFVEKLKNYFTERKNISVDVYFQDESWTSEVAKDRLASKKHQITRQDRDSGAVDSEAAAVILQDFLESPRLHGIEAEINQKKNKLK